MHNEELVVRAKSGDQAAMTQLWEQNRGLLATLFRRLVSKAGTRMDAMGVTWEDIEQTFYLVIADAVQRFDPQAGASFATFLTYPVKQHFFDMLGWHTQKQKHDPLAQAVSLDEPITHEGDKVARGALVPNTAAAQALEQVEQNIYTEQLHQTLETCLSTLDEQQAQAVRCRYFDDLPRTAAAERLGCTPSQARQLEYKGLQRLRLAQNKQRLQQFRDEIISTHSYRGTGFSAWKHGGSVQERVIVHLEEKGLLL